jgi:hypothetical protein
MEINYVPLKTGIETIISKLLVHEPLAMEEGQIAKDLAKACPGIEANHVKTILEFVIHSGHVVVVDSRVTLTRFGRDRARALQRKAVCSASN